MTDLWAGLEAATERPLRPVPDQPADTGHHDHGAEVAILAGCAWDPSAIDHAAAEGITGTSFHRPEHEIIWNSLRTLRASDAPTDHAALADELRRRATKPALRALTDLPGIYTTVAEATAVPHHARTVVRHARARHGATLALRLKQAYESPDPDFERIDTLLREHLEDQAAGPATPNTWAPVDLTDALAGNGPDDTPALMPRSDGPCLLYPGAVHVLSGEPTSGKTWLALYAAVQEMTAGNDVAFIDFEDRALRVVARLLLIGAHPDQVAKHFRYIRPEVALDTTGRAAIDQAVTGTTLTVIDGVTEAMTLHGLDLSSNPDVATFYALLPRRIANLGPTVVLIDHVVKDSERQGRWSIGGQHKVAGIDGAAYTVKCVEPFGRGKRGTARVFIAKDRHGHVEEHALGRCAAEFHLDSTDPLVSVATLDPPEAMPTTDGGDLRPTHLMDRVSRYLEIHPDSTGAAIDAAKLGKAQYVRKALQQLVAEGHVEVRPGPRNASFHHVIEPFRRDGDTPEWGSS